MEKGGKRVLRAAKVIGACMDRTRARRLYRIHAHKVLHNLGDTEVEQVGKPLSEEKATIPEVTPLARIPSKSLF